MKQTVVNRKGKTKPFSGKMMLPMMAVLLLFTLVLSMILLWGTTQRLNYKAWENFVDRVTNTTQQIESYSALNWESIADTAVLVNQRAQQALGGSGATPEQLAAHPQLAAEILNAAFPVLLQDMGKRPVQGIFMALCTPEQFAEGQQTRLSGVYLMDTNLEHHSSSFSDIRLNWAPPELVADDRFGVAELAGYTEGVPLNATGENPAYLSQPVLAAEEHPQLTHSQLGIWSNESELMPGEENGISYSVPLIIEGQVYGVLGIALAPQQLSELMPNTERMENGTTAYAIGREGDTFSPVAFKGTAEVLQQDQLQNVKQETVEYDDVYRLQDKSGTEYYSCVLPLHLMDESAPYEQNWVLVGLITEDELFSFGFSMLAFMLIAMAVALLLGMLLTVAVSRLFTRPVKRLANSVSNTSAQSAVTLPRSGIEEVDQLAEAVEVLSSNVASGSMRLSTMVGMASVPFAAFEYDEASTHVLITGKLMQILGCNDEPDRCSESIRYLDREDFTTMMDQLAPYQGGMGTEPGVKLYELAAPEPGGPHRYIRIKTSEAYGHVMGVAEDVTQKMWNAQQKEFEYAHDELTGLHNKETFRRQLALCTSAAEETAVGVLMMLDLDNLKHVNVKYGMDTGDAYIRFTADALRQYAPEPRLLSRMAADEFHVFLYGFATKEDARHALAQLRANLFQSCFTLPDGANQKLRASMSAAWYPDDAKEAGTLLQYVDFAMRYVKSTCKGQLYEYSPITYRRWSYMVDAQEDLDILIDDARVDYAFQPIISAKDGSVYGYEALMRSRDSILKSPSEILALARSQSKLYQIEKITWFGAMDAFVRLSSERDGFKVFINSISNQFINESELDTFSVKYEHYLSRIVLEMLETEPQHNQVTHRKLARLKSWNAELALDDFGSGYNGDGMLLSLSPQYVKIDMSLVRGIGNDLNRQKLLQNILSYTSDHNIKVIAEGVERYDELKTLVEMGVDYLQGFYFGKAAFELSEPGETALEELRQINESKNEIVTQSTFT